MGEQADLIMDGDVCQVCGENFGDEGSGFPRTCAACQPTTSIKPIKHRRMTEAAFALMKASISFQQFNNGLHWKIGTIDFWPSTGKWICQETDMRGMGYQNLIAHIQRPQATKAIKELSIEQLFNIAKSSKDKSLFGICETIHKELYT